MVEEITTSGREFGFRTNSYYNRLDNLSCTESQPVGFDEKPHLSLHDVIKMGCQGKNFRVSILSGGLTLTIACTLKWGLASKPHGAAFSDRRGLGMKQLLISLGVVLSFISCSSAPAPVEQAKPPAEIPITSKSPEAIEHFKGGYERI